MISTPPTTATTRAGRLSAHLSGLNENPFRARRNIPRNIRAFILWSAIRIIGRPTGQLVRCSNWKSLVSAGILLSVVVPASVNPSQAAYAQQSWHMPGYPQFGRLGARNQPMIGNRYVNTHSFECFDLRRSPNLEVPPRSCLIGGGVAIHVSSKDFLPKLRIDAPTGVLPPTISEVIRGELKRIVFCPQYAGRYVVNVTSGTVSVQGEYSIEALYAPNCGNL